MKKSLKWYEIVLILTGVLVAVGVAISMTREKGVALSTGAIETEEARAIMYGLLERPDERNRLLDRIVEANDTRFIIVLMDTYAMLGGNGYATGERIGPYAIVSALETLAGVEYGDSCSEWFRWYRDTDYTPPPGYPEWKGFLLSIHNRKLRSYFQDDMKSTIRLEEIVWGGVSEKGLPPLNNPKNLAPAEAQYLNDSDAVVGIVVNGDARAYPLRIIDWHEMVNDEIGDTPVCLAYCTLCNAAVAYDRRATGETIHTFDSSGCLYRSNKLMIDEATGSLWNQMTGEPVAGALVGQAATLTKLPTVTTTWGRWRTRHPTTRVLSDDTGHDRDYTPGYAYGDYFSGDKLKKYATAVDDRLPPKRIVFGMTVKDTTKAWTIDHLTATPVLHDAVESTEIVLITAPNAVVVKGLAGGKRDVQYDAGAEVRAYALEDGLRLSRNDATGALTDTQGNTWRLTEEALMGPDGRQLLRLPGHLAYWFGWSDFYPDTLLDQ